jgi:hypothetical protein
MVGRGLRLPYGERTHDKDVERKRNFKDIEPEWYCEKSVS